MKFFAAPVSSDLSYKNYIKSVVNGVKPSNVTLHLWGLKKDKISVWDKIKKEDIIFFYYKKHFISYSKVIDKEQNEKMAIDLWGYFSNAHYRHYTWPLLIHMTKPKPCNIPFPKIGEILNYDSKYFLRRFFELNKNLSLYIEENYKDFNEFISKESV